MRAITAVILLLSAHRNLFQYVEPPPKKIVTRKVIAQPAVQVERQAPSPVVVVVVEAPKPPQFPYRCIGRFGPEGNPFAVFDAGGAIINVRAGEVIDGKFIVRGIGFESVTIGVEGFPDRLLSIGD